MYDYLEQVTADVRDYVEQEINLSEWAGDRDGLEEKLNDDLWTCDSVTGTPQGKLTNQPDVRQLVLFKPLTNVFTFLHVSASSFHIRIL